MNLQQLADLLENWYGVAPGELGLDAAATAHIANPTLREFYERLGVLAEPGTRLAHSKSHHRPLATQDRVLPVNELRREGDATVFAVENQGVFVIAASDQTNQTNAHVAGDVGDLRLRHLTDIGVPLNELLVTLALSETIFSVQDRYRATSPSLLKSRTAAISGAHYRGRYVWPEHYSNFWLFGRCLVHGSHWLRMGGSPGLLEAASGVTAWCATEPNTRHCYSLRPRIRPGGPLLRGARQR